MSDQPQRLGALLGSFDSLSSEQREAIVTYLREAWIAQTGSAPGGFSVDLESLQRVFSPEVTPKSIRAAAQSLIAVPRERPNIPAELYLPVTSRAGFVTPEGRLLLELGDDREVTHLLDLTLRLVRFYGSTHRKVVARAVSIGGDLRPQTLGFYYFLLLNGCLGESHALMVPKDRRDERELATAVMRVAEAFSTSIGGSPVATRERDSPDEQLDCHRGASPIDGRGAPRGHSGNDPVLRRRESARAASGDDLGIACQATRGGPHEGTTCRGNGAVYLLGHPAAAQELGPNLGTLCSRP